MLRPVLLYGTEWWTMRKKEEDWEYWEWTLGVSLKDMMSEGKVWC
jgi:hypothetical protein